MNLGESFSKLFVQLLVDLLIDEPREVRLLQLTLWVGVGVILWGHFNALRTPICTFSLLIISLGITVALYILVNKFMDRFMNDIVPINEVFTSIGNIMSFIKRLEEGNIIEDIIKSRGGLRRLLRYVPFSLLPCSTASLIVFSLIFAMDTILQPFVNVNSYKAVLVGVGIIVLSIVMLIIVKLVRESAESMSQGSSANRGNYMDIYHHISTYINDIVNRYFNPTNVKPIISFAYKVIRNLLLIFPKLKIHVNPPKAYVGIYICNEKLRDELIKFVEEYADSNVMNNYRKNLKEVFRCSDVSKLEDLNNVGSMYEFFTMDNNGSSAVITLMKGDKRMTMLIKAWKYCIFNVRDLVRDSDPKHRKATVKCRHNRRVITILAIGHTELLGKLNLILNTYSRPPT